MNQTFVSDDITVEVDERPGCFVNAQVQLSPKKSLKIYQRCLQELRKEVSLPGFRKGKAPLEFIKQRYQDRLHKEWQKTLADSAVKDGIALTGSRLFDKDSLKKISIVSCSEEEGARLELEYEKFPSVPTVIWKDISLPPAEALTPVSEEDIAKQIERIRFFLAKWESKTGDDILVTEDDYVVLSAFVKNENSSVTLFEKKRFSLKDKELSANICPLVIGQKPGYSFETLITDADIISWIHGDRIVFTIDEVSIPTLPEVNDEFFKTIRAESLEDLHSKITTQLTRQAELFKKEKRLEQLEEELCNLYDFELPTSFVNKQPLEQLTREHLLSLRCLDFVSDEELATQKAQLPDELAAKARRNIKLFFLAQQIFSQEKLSLSNQEIEMEMYQCAQENTRKGKSMENLTPQEIQELASFARERLICKKAFETALTKVESIPQNS